jgi:signal transduction histidine kinase
MSKAPLTGQAPTSRTQRVIARFLKSRVGNTIARFPPVAWVIRTTTRSIIRRGIGQTIQSRIAIERIVHADLESTLKGVVIDVVETLGYIAAMVATYEIDDSLPARAYYANPEIASEDQIHLWEAQVSQASGLRLSLTDQSIARVYVNNRIYDGNLSVQAFKSQKPERSSHLFNLLTPVVPDGKAIQSVVQGIQDALGIREVIAVPFFLETAIDGETQREFVGNLFALSRNMISSDDEQILAAFGRQVAAAILSERRLRQIQAVQDLIFDMQANLQNEQHILGQIVEGVVEGLGYIGAMVATYEPDDSLPARAYYMNQAIAAGQQIQTWEQQVSEVSGLNLSLTDPKIARVYVHQEKYKHNLSVRAYQTQKPVRDARLYSLFTPIVPEGTIVEEVVQGIQEALGVHEVIAVPFFLERVTDQHEQRELVGNLFALTRSKHFSSGEIELLQAFGQQAAVGIRNARLYRQSEDRREQAQVFGKMAFSAAASVHALRNHVGAVRGNLQLLGMLDRFPEQERDSLLKDLSRPVIIHLDQIADTLETLHEPWRIMEDTLIDINLCLLQAIRKLTSESDRESWVKLDLQEPLPEISTSDDMMVEALRVLIKNAVEALAQKNSPDRKLQIKTRLKDESVIEVTIHDNGTGIQPEHLSKIFEMRWTTKQGGLGFGLFWTKDYIEGLNGTLTAKSIVGESTTFQLTIPVETKQPE